MTTSFHHDFNSPPGNNVYDDEELALQLMAEELAFQSPSGKNQREGVPYKESPQTVAGPMAYITQRDLEFARMLQVREDEQSMFATSAEDSRTDLELAKMLQVDADEQMVVEVATEDKKSDLELAMLLQQEEDIAANDFLLAQQLQEEMEQEGGKRCQRCGHQNCLCHHGRRRRQDEEANYRHPDHGVSDDSTIHQFFQSGFALPGVRLGDGRGSQHSNDDDDEDYESLLELGDTIGEARPQGLERAEMNALPTCHFHSNSQSTPTTHVENDSDSNSCRICFCAFSENDVLRTLPCLHRFHRDCIDQWIQRKAVCPICRVEIRDHIDGSSTH